MLFEDVEDFPYISVKSGGRGRKLSDYHSKFLIHITPKIMIKYKIGYTETPCHLGGTRLWLHCPECKRRSLYLYFIHDRFLCRKCGRIIYHVQRQSKYYQGFTRTILGAFKNQLQWEALRKKFHKGKLTKKARLIFKKRLEINDLSERIYPASIYDSDEDDD